MARRWRSAMNLASFNLAANVVCNPNQFNKLGEYIIKAKELISLGNGNLSGMDNATGRIFAKFQDATPAEVTGILRLEIYNPQDQPQKILFELRTEALNTNAADRTKQTPFAQMVEDISEDMKIVMSFKPDGAAAKTIVAANSTLVMDITQGAE